MITVNVRRLNKPTREYTVPEGSTVADVLRIAGLANAGHVLLDGSPASVNDRLTGAEVTLTVTEGQPKGA